MSQERKKITDGEIPTSAIINYLKTGKARKYSEKFAKMLVEHGINGEPYDTFGATLGVPTEVIDEWVETHPPFKRAKEYYDTYFKDFWHKKLASSKRNDNAQIMKMLAQNYLGLKITDKGVDDLAARPETTQLLIEQESNDKQEEDKA